ncbi:MAG TPA: single-stranded-DNA-specific exonuclease RecJ, partial [Longimicrobiales bacterium]|nr:single-stranded-DNA-specific exonuclease RecJ [Longimicrobiales bacterium]
SASDPPRPPGRWQPRHAAEPDAAAVAALATRLRLPDPVCRLLVLRGHGDEPLARRYLRPPLDALADPASMAGIDAAVARICAAIDRDETILVHGDYDVDGMCAAALFTRVLRELGARVEGFVPHRVRDGYDLGAGGLAEAKRVGARLLLTADCGMLAHDAIRAARAVGLDVVVTDHHTPGPTLPEALAVVNPGRPDCAYPEKGLCGTGVAFKVCWALARARGHDPTVLRWYLDLVALATVADIMPLAGENRVMVHFGLRVLRETRNAGLSALLEVAGLADTAPLASGHLSHALGPRLNAVGRLDDAALGLRLLLTDDPAEAARLARRLEEENTRRQRIDRDMLAQALEQLERGFDPERDRGVVLAGEGWHPGVIGIVASRVVERIHRPTIMVALDGGRARGSGRSIPGFDLVAALRECAPLLERFGGHRMAAGMDLLPGRVDAFREAFDAVARARLGPEQLVPATAFDLELRLADAGPELHRFLRYMAPFGVGNPTPVFVARGVSVDGAPRVVGRDHLRLGLVQDGARLGAIGFRMADRAAELAGEGARLDVAFQLHEDEWRGRRRLQAKLVDLRPAEGLARRGERAAIPA